MGVHRQRPGIILLTILVALTLLSTLVMEFLYNSRVKLALSVNARDEVKAYYNARSGFNLIRLALEFQYELMEEPGIIGQATTRSNFQLWQYLDLFLPTFVSARVDSPIGSLDLMETGAIGFGNVEGDIVFHDPVPEEGKINLNSFSGWVLEQDALLQLCSLFAPTQYDDLFGDDDVGLSENLPTRGEVIGAIIDFVDADSDMVVVDENCQIVPSGSGTEDRRYRDVNYTSKNEPFVTLDEVLLVAGMTPELLDTFRDNLTVYEIAHKFYVNLADARGFMGFLCAHVTEARGLGQLQTDERFNACRIPGIAVEVAFLSLALEGWNAFFSNPYALLDFYLGLSTGQAEQRVAEGIAGGQMIAFRTEQDFMTVLDLFLDSPETATQYAMLADPQRAALFGYLASGGAGPGFTRFSIGFDHGQVRQRIAVDIPRVYTISATGTYGVATRTITAVVDYNQEGRLLYYREY